jgi:hypothetical protein
MDSIPKQSNVLKLFAKIMRHSRPDYQTQLVSI